MPKTSRIAALADFDRDYLDGRSFVLGIDEAGRGALAGPVCAGAVAVSAKLYDSPEALSMLSALNDSKQISHEARESLFSELEKLKKAQMLDFEAGLPTLPKSSRKTFSSPPRLRWRARRKP